MMSERKKVTEKQQFSTVAYELLHQKLVPTTVGGTEPKIMCVLNKTCPVLTLGGVDY